MSGISGPTPQAPAMSPPARSERPPQRDRDGVEHGDTELPFERGRQRGAVEIGTEDDDGIGALRRDRADHVGDRRGRDLAEGKIVAQAEMPLGVRGDPLLGPDIADTPLHVVRIGRDQADAACAPSARTASMQASVDVVAGTAGPRRDRFAQAPVAADTEPACRRAVPGDGIDLGVRQQIRRRQHHRGIELVQRRGIERDLGDAEAREMGGDAGHAMQHGVGDGLQHRVGRRRDHAEALAQN